MTSLSGDLDKQTGAVIPAKGEWPVDPQDAVDVSNDTFWIDGCFDFAHHGHAGAILQAKQQGSKLYVGVHSDEEILEHKGPPVMTLPERVAAARACRWSDIVVPNAPYVTSIPWIDHYGCGFVVHGDDISTDSSGGDAYRFVKAAKRMTIVRRTPGISTTDLVSRLLDDNKSTDHHILPNLNAILDGSASLPKSLRDTEPAADMLRRIEQYATDATARLPLLDVNIWVPDSDDSLTMEQAAVSRWTNKKLVIGDPPASTQRVVYVDGTFDLFSTGHIEFLRQVVEAEHHFSREQAAKNYMHDPRGSVSPTYMVVGIHDDDVVNNIKGSNYPIMNIFERGLCVLQCKYVDALIFSAPFIPNEPFFDAFPYRKPDAVYSGQYIVHPDHVDPYEYPKKLGWYREIGPHKWSDVTVGKIKARVLENRMQFEARQRAKGIKSTAEAELEQREKSRINDQ